MVLMAYQNAVTIIPDSNCYPVVCDLAHPHALRDIFQQRQIPGASRIVTAFGILPNCEPDELLSRLAVTLQACMGSRPSGARPSDSFNVTSSAALQSQSPFDDRMMKRRKRRAPPARLADDMPATVLPPTGSSLDATAGEGDFLLLSANLAPGPDYGNGVRRVAGLYDNPLTRDWLLTFLLDLGVEPDDGDIRFLIEEPPGGAGLKRIVACFHFTRPRQFQLGREAFHFVPGDSLRLFFSYRHTPALLERQLRTHRFVLLDKWISKSEEEGVFLAKKAF